MNILISAYDCDPYAGSEAAIGWGWTYYNALEGNRVWCITREEHRENIEAFCKANPMDNLSFIFLEGSSPLFKLYNKIPTLGLYAYYLHWQWEAYRIAASLSQEVALDLVHHVSYGSLQLGTYMWKLPVPLIFGPIGGGQFTHAMFKPYFYKEWWKEKLRALISIVLTEVLPNTRRALKKAAFVPVTNDETFALAAKLGSTKIDYFLDTGIKPAFFPEHWAPKTPSKEMKVLWVGRMLPRKGLLLALEVFENLPSEYPITLTVLGGGPDLTYMREKVEEKKLTDRVKCLGKVPFETVADYYQNHDVFFFSSVRDSFGSQLLEAMTYKLPILALDMFGAKMFVPKEAGIKVPVKDIEQSIQGLVDGLIYFYKNPQARIVAGEAGFRFATSESWPVRIHRMQEKYREICGISVKS